MKPWTPICLVLLSSVLAGAQTVNSHPVAKPSRAEETLEIMHCLKAGDLDWTVNSPLLESARTFRVGLRHDRITYQHQDHVIVVVFENPLRGDVFELTRTNARRRRIYRIENNGEFKIGKRGIEWPGEILGGNWTHGYLEESIRKILLGQKAIVQLNTLLTPMPKVTCTSYVSTAEAPSSN